MTQPGTDRRSRDRGAAAVEMALVMPLLLLVLFGIIDFGRMLNAQITLTEAAREGARAAAYSDSTPAADATARVNTMINGATTSLSSSCDTGTTATVKVTLAFKFITPVSAFAGLFAKTGPGNSYTLSSTGVMTCTG